MQPHLKQLGLTQLEKALPTLFETARQEQWTYELFLTHATLITAEPDARRLFEGPRRPGGTARLERVSLHEHAGEWYERSRVRYG